MADITGVAILTLYELKTKKEISILRYLIADKFMLGFNKRSQLIFRDDMDLEFIYKKLIECDFTDMSVRHLLFVANCWVTFENQYLYKLFQIREYDWVSSDQVSLMLERFAGLSVSKNSMFESVITVKSAETMGRRLVGRVDCVDTVHKKIYEFKCVRQLKKEHIHVYKLH